MLVLRAAKIQTVEYDMQVLNAGIANCGLSALLAKTCAEDPDAFAEHQEFLDLWPTHLRKIRKQFLDKICDRVRIAYELVAVAWVTACWELKLEKLYSYKARARAGHTLLRAALGPGVLCCVSWKICLSFVFVSQNVFNIKFAPDKGPHNASFF